MAPGTDDFNSVVGGGSTNPNVLKTSGVLLKACRLVHIATFIGTKTRDSCSFLVRQGTALVL